MLKLSRAFRSREATVNKNTIYFAQELTFLLRILVSMLVHHLSVNLTP